MEDEVFGEDITTTSEITIKYSVRQILFSVICLITICCDSLIIYIIFRFNRVRTIATILVANWIIVDLLDAIYTPFILMLHRYADDIPLSYRLQCTLYNSSVVLLFGVISFASAALQDWFLAAYFEKASRNFRKYYKVVIILTWIFVLLNLSSVAAHCYGIGLRVNMADISYLISYSAMLLIVVLLQLIKAVQKCSNKPLKYPTFILMLTTGLTVIIFPAYIFLSIRVLSDSYHHWLSMLGGSMRFSSGILTLMLFYSLNKDFRRCLLRVINRSTEGEEENY